MNVSTTLAKTWTDGRSGSDLGGRFNASWDSRLSRVGVSLTDVGENFNAEMGFIRFTTNTVNSRSIYSFSPDFFIKLFLQWNDEADIVRGNFLIRYTYQPGSDLYIVYNELWREKKVQQRSIVAKVVYFLNL
ncbi:hypothetical protein HYR99_04540 [Candidatus Poribacteria bacterium]|nr:hypothetical protein [Candidatus Poribacteria bacterium]